MIKLLEYTYPSGWGDGEFVLEINNKKHRIQDKLIQGHYYPEGNLYYEFVDEQAMTLKLIYQNCERFAEPSYASQGYRLINVVLGIGSVASVARILQGYKVEQTGHYFNTFINDDGEKQAIAYPYPEVDWEKFKETNEAYREASIFEEKVKEELLEKDFVQNEQGYWIQGNSTSK